MKKRRAEKGRIKHKLDKEKSSKLKNFFLINWRKFFIIVFFEVFFLYLHDFFSWLLKTEEIIFYFIAVYLIPFYTLISLAYTLIKQIKRR